MKYLLDTNVWVDYLNGQYPGVTRRIQRCPPEDICCSSIVIAELRYGADKSQNKVANHAKLDVLTAEIQCLDFDLEAATAFGRVRVALEEAGRVIGPYDMLIAAHALSRQLILVTDNVGEFSRVKDLEVENWRDERAVNVPDGGAAVRSGSSPLSAGSPAPRRPAGR